MVDSEKPVTINGPYHMVRDYKDLEVWKKGVNVTVQLYGVLSGYPKEETYALVDQIKRSAVSIVSNIAEGASRHSPKEFIQFLYVAMGSASELETQIIISEKLGYTDKAQFIIGEITSIRKMLNALISSLKRRRTHDE